MHSRKREKRVKITCTQTDLNKGLSVVGHALSSRSTLPILSCLHLFTEQGRLKVSATNLEVGITWELPATVEEEGAIALPARLLTEFVSSLPPGNVTLSVAQGELTAQIEGQRSRAHIKGMDPAEYPALATDLDLAPLCKFEAGPLKEAIAQTAFAAASDDSRPVLTSVLLQGHEDGITFAAADAFQLAVRTLLFPVDGESFGDLLIPAKALTELARILPTDGQVELIVPKNRS